MAAFVRRSLNRIAPAPFAVLATFVVGCAGAGSAAPPRTPAADKWFKRAQQDYGEVRIDEAHEALEKALSLAPQDEEIRLLGGRIALARLEYGESLQMLRDLPGSEAHGLRGRAHWYNGDLGPAADELEAMLEDPDVRDDWAKSIASLSRIGEARAPFTTSGARVAAVEMAHVSPVAPYLVIPVEIDGEQALAMLSTGIAEVVIDSASRAEPSWVSIRFGGTLEVSDVPALSQDLTGISKELNAPIKALIGVNLLRHVNATIDYAGHQFVARAYAPPPPPNATRVDLFYARGGGMMVSTPLSANADSRAALFVDSSMRYPLALDERGWLKAGISPNDLKPVEGDPEHKLKQGVVPLMRFGAFDVHGIPAVLGAPITEIEKGLRFDIDGVIGCPMLAQYRITLADGGRMMWVEDDSAVRALLSEPQDDLSNPGPDLGPGAPPMGQPLGQPGAAP